MSNEDEEVIAPRKNPLFRGNESAEATLYRAAQSARMAHAWLIAGPRGIGKATLAYRFARHLLAGPVAAEAGLFGDVPAADLSLDPEHPVFRRVASGGHADLLTVERSINPQSKKLRTEIVVDDVRAATGFLHRTASEGGWRVVIVDTADEMNRAAANALLKILEEPPPATVFLLVTHAPGRLLPTIRSRCRTLTLQPLPSATVLELLGQYRPELSAEDAAALTGLSEGSIGAAMDLAEAGGLDLYRDMVRLLAALPRLDIPGVHALGDRLSRANAAEAFETFGRLLQDWLSRIVREGAQGRLPSEIVPGEREAFAAMTAQANLAQILEVWEKVSRLFTQADHANLDRKQVLIAAFLALQATVNPETV
ncbi:MAG: DNA polymerase III subunit delta' [Alphaproteobacteria bacterium]